MARPKLVENQTRGKTSAEKALAPQKIIRAQKRQERLAKKKAGHENWVQKIYTRRKQLREKTGHNFRKFTPREQECSIKGCDEPFDYLFGGGQTDRWKRNSNPLKDTVFGRHREPSDRHDDRLATAPIDEPTLPAPQTPLRGIKRQATASQDLISAESGEMRTAKKNRPRRPIASFNIEVTTSEKFKRFNLTIWKLDHGTPTKQRVRDILNKAKILKPDPQLVPVKEKNINLSMTKKSLKTAMSRVGRTKGQSRVMGIFRAVPAKDAYPEMRLEENQIIVEWSHLGAHRFAAHESQVPTNLVITTKECNTQMEALESAIQQTLQDSVPLTINVTADTIGYTHVAKAIEYTVFFENGNAVTVQFDPAATERTDLGLKQYFYALLCAVKDDPKNADQVVPKPEPKPGSLKYSGLFKPAKDDDKNGDGVAKVLLFNKK